MDICYPDGTDWACMLSEEEVIERRSDPTTSARMARSEALAWSTLSALTGYRLSLCPVTIRPCAQRCMLPTWYVAPVQFTGYPTGGVFAPYVMNGSWYNACGCGSGGCSCTSIQKMILPSEVGGIEEVWLDGVLLPQSEYRVDNGRELVLTNGDHWPTCQDMNINNPEDGGVWVRYYPGVAPNDLFRYAAGVLANEFYLACSGSDCRLPNGVTNVTRAGISMQVQTGLFTNNMTGITEVDAILRIYNPYGLKARARALSPDVERGRVRTWGA